MAGSSGEMNPLVARLHVYGRERQAPKAQACAIYARVSDDRQESLPVQLDQCRRYAARLGLPVAQEYTDEESGLITTRREYQQLMTLARAGRISHVVVFHSSRFGREDGEFVTAARELERLGVELHTTGLGRIDPGMVGMHAMINNMEVRNISAHVLPNMIARAQRGLEMGRTRYGYRRTLARGVREPDPETFPIVQEMFRRYQAGATVWAVTKWFNERTGLQKRTFGVKKLLSDPYYAGIYVYNRSRNSKIDGSYLKPRSEWVWAEHAHPAVDQEAFAAVQARLGLNVHIGQERVKGPRYALSGLLWCAACSKRMHGQPDQTGKYGFYHCPYCGRSKSLRKVHAALRRLIATIPQGVEAIDAALAAAAATETKESQANAADVAARMEKLRARRRRLTELYADGEIPPSDYHAVRTETDNELAALQAEQGAAQIAVAGDYSVAITTAWLRTLPTWDALDADAEPAEQNTHYRRLLAACLLDVPGGQFRARWLPGVALLTGVAVAETDL